MRRVGWCACVVLLVGVVSGPAVWAQGTVEELLRAVPADAMATVVVRSFTGLQQDLAMVADTVMPGQGMVLPMVLERALDTPAGQGLNLQNSLGVVFLAFESGDVGTGVLLPMDSYADFSSALEVMGFTMTTEDGLDAYSAEGFTGPVTYYAAGEGAYRFWTKDRAAAAAYQQKFQAQVPMLAAELPAATKALMAEADLSVYAPMADLAPRVQTFAGFMVAQMQVASAQPGLSEQQAAQVQMGQQVLLLELEALGEVLVQVDWGLLTVDMGPDGITARAHLRAKPETTVARFFGTQGGGETALLGQLPAESWMAVSGKVELAPIIPALKDFSMKLIEAMGVTDEETKQRYERAMEAMELHTGEMALAMVPGGEGGGFVNVVEFFTVSDPARALESMRDGVMMWQGTPAGSTVGGGMLDFSGAEVTSLLETYRGVEISQVTVPVTVPEGMPPMAAPMIQAIYGEQFVYQYGAVGNTIILSLGTRANELIKKGIDGLKDGATGLGQGPAYQSATAGLPKSRSLTSYFSLVKAVQAGFALISGSMGAMGEGAPPVPSLDVESLEGITPSGVGVALSFDGAQATLDVYLPQTELANLSILIRQLMGAAFGPGAPGPPTPMPPPME